ncbi:MAG: hypothetical protein ACE10C_08980 [Candidatus Binatia bacterium]
MPKEVPKQLEENRCWCGHLERWRSVAGVCRWWAKMELRPQFNFMPRPPSSCQPVQYHPTICIDLPDDGHVA